MHIRGPLPLESLNRSSSSLLLSLFLDFLTFMRFALGIVFDGSMTVSGALLLFDNGLGSGSKDSCFLFFFLSFFFFVSGGFARGCALDANISSMESMLKGGGDPPQGVPNRVYHRDLPLA